MYLAPEWIRWIEENREAGVPDTQLADVLIQRGVSSRRAVEELARIPAESDDNRRPPNSIELPKLASRQKGYREVNSDAWDVLARRGIHFSVPYGRAELTDARAKLTEVVALPWPEIDTVLCLAAGGGHQSLLFASLGLKVVVFDLSKEQLNRDRNAASRLGMEIECLVGDMADLSALHGRQFDLVYQPVSMCYVPDPSRVYGEVAAVLRLGGWYCVEHWNPVRMQLDHLGRNGPPYAIVRPQGTRKPFRFGYAAEELEDNAGPEIAWHYIHSLGGLLGPLVK
jgi:SAM-dependent methyltransferase